MVEIHQALLSQFSLLLKFFVEKVPIKVLADWFARKNIDDTMIFIQYLLLFLFKFDQLLPRIIHSNLEVCFTTAPS